MNGRAGGARGLHSRSRAVVIGLGNACRHDDAAGLAVAALIRAASLPGVQTLEVTGEPLSLVDCWGDAPVVYVVDAVASGGEPGEVYRFDASSDGLPAPWRRLGTHAFSLADVVELARALGRAPGRLIVYGIEGAEFGTGTGLSPQAKAGVATAVSRLASELSSIPQTRAPG